MTAEPTVLTTVAVDIGRSTTRVRVTGAPTADSAAADSAAADSAATGARRGAGAGLGDRGGADAVARLVRDAVGAGPSTPWRLAVGVPGALARPAAADALARQLGRGWPRPPELVLVASDIAAWHAGALPDRDGVVLSVGTGAVALGLAVDNSTGTSRPFAFSGSLYFVGVDSPCSGNAGFSAAFISRNSGQAWDVGFGVQSGSVSGSAFISPGFRVDPSGNETALTNTATSDERLKDIHGPFNRGLAEIIQVNPILYNWKESPDKPALGGVSAQDVRRVIPEAVSEIDAEGHLGVSDRPLVAALINSVKELKSANDNLRACQASWRCRLFGP